MVIYYLNEWYYCFVEFNFGDEARDRAVNSAGVLESLPNVKYFQDAIGSPSPNFHVE